MSETGKLINALSKVDTCIYLFVEEFDAHFQPKNSLKSTRGLRKLTMDEINSSKDFDTSKPAFRIVGMHEVYLHDIRAIDLITLLEEFSRYQKETEQDEYYSLDEFLEEVKWEERLNPTTFGSISQSKMIYSINLNNEIKDLKQGTSIVDITGDEIIIDGGTFEIGMNTRAGVIVGKKLFWLP